jgi:ppGpp synthetase/RelA/SpoT-type nucleotidyltranferase
MNAVRRAGKRLAGDIIWRPDEREKILATFAIANSWRDSHVLPMRSVRMSVIQRMRHIGAKGFTAARPKRMSSIRKKLRRLTVKLDQINDIAGCRAVLKDISDVKALIEECRARLPHELFGEYDYIENPKPDGYRSHHMAFRFQHRDGYAAYNGRRVELQIRTRLQHSWATAVEAVGLYRDEDMKAGQGDHDWLRLFQLMSAEFAHVEGCPLNGDFSERSKRVSEIKDLNKRLGAGAVLEDIKNVTHFAREYIQPSERPHYYLIRYSRDARTGQNMVTVEGYANAIVGSRSLAEAEQLIERGEDDSKVVLVEVSKVDSLVEAYPNYFGDVSLFIENLKSICDGKQAIEYSMAPQKVVAPRPDEKPDFTWLRRRYTRWTERR